MEYIFIAKKFKIYVCLFFFQKMQASVAAFKRGKASEGGAHRTHHPRIQEAAGSDFCFHSTVASLSLSLSVLVRRASVRPLLRRFKTTPRASVHSIRRLPCLALPSRVSFLPRRRPIPRFGSQPPPPTQVRTMSSSLLPSSSVHSVPRRPAPKQLAAAC